IERIEVLRGPQGTLYGRNTSARAIKHVSREPDEETRLMLEGTVGNHERIDVRASVPGKLADGLHGQHAFLSRQRDGWAKNLVNGADVNDQDVLAGRASLRWQPNERLDILISYDEIRDHSDPAFATGVLLQPPADLGLWDKNQQVDGDRDVYTLRSDLTNPMSEIDQRGASLNISYDLGAVTLRSITAWREMSSEFVLDADGQDTCFGFDLPCLHLYQDQDQEQFSQELQASGQAFGGLLDYVFGVYYFREENSQITENMILAPMGQNDFADTTLDTDSIAVFASGSWHLGERWTITTGIRWTR